MTMGDPPAVSVPPDPPAAQPRRWWAVACVVGLVVLYVVWTRIQLGGEAVTLAFSDIIIGLAAAAAGVTCIAARRRVGGWPGRGWLLIGIGMLFWALGEAIWTVYEVVLGVEVPFPSLADAGFLVMVPLTLVGMAAMLDFRRSALRTLLDGLIVAGSLLYVSWPLVLEPTYRAGGQSLLVRSIALAYPIGDIVVASMVFVLLSQTARQARGSLALAGAGMLALAVSDSGFAYLTVHASYVSGSLIDPGWFAGFLVIALAGLRSHSGSGVAGREDTAPLLVALPYVPLAAAMATATVVQLTRGSMGSFLFLSGIVLVSLVVLRQVVTLRENLALTRKVSATVVELSGREDELRHLAFHDPLTGLANRALLQRETERAVDRQVRDRAPLGIIYIDLDGFKQVNDSFGHAAGDALLIAAAARLRRCTRPSDTVARVGGDEFAMLLDGLTTTGEAEKLARRIVAELSELYQIDGHTIRIGASVGFSVQEHGLNQAGELLRQADMAMYHAKFTGRGTYVRFESWLTAGQAA